jgi:cytidylate kinase
VVVRERIPFYRRHSPEDGEVMHPSTLPLEALAQAQQYWQDRKPTTEVPLTVALTREAGTPGTSVAREVGARLGWQVYDHELLEHVAREMGLRVNLLESVDERRRNWLLEIAENFAGGPYVSEAGFLRHLVQTILSLGEHGRCVIVGRGAAYLLPEAAVLRVRLIGPREERITAAAARFNFSHAEAVRWVDETDRHRERFVRESFQKDPTDLKSYDLIFNSSRWSIVESAELIVQAVHQRQSRGAK